MKAGVYRINLLRKERRICADIARKTAHYYRALARTQEFDDNMRDSYRIALARAETAEQIAAEIEDF